MASNGATALVATHACQPRTWSRNIRLLGKKPGRCPFVICAAPRAPCNVAEDTRASGRTTLCVVALWPRECGVATKCTRASVGLCSVCVGVLRVGVCVCISVVCVCVFWCASVSLCTRSLFFCAFPCIRLFPVTRFRSLKISFLCPQTCKPVKTYCMRMPCMLAAHYTQLPDTTTNKHQQTYTYNALVLHRPTLDKPHAQGTYCESTIMHIGRT